MVEKKADINKLDLQKRSALSYAILQGSVECAKFLVEAKSSLSQKDKNEQNAVHLVAQMGQVEVLETMLSVMNSLDLNVSDGQGYSALHLAIYHKKKECVQMLLSLAEKQPGSVKLAKSSQDGTTPLQIASFLGDVLTVERLLLSNEAKVDQVDNRGLTALHYASLSNSLPCVELLLRHGALAKSTSVNGELPVDLTSDENIKGVIHCPFFFNQASQKSHLKSCFWRRLMSTVMTRQT